MKLILSLFIYLLFFSIAYATDSEENIQIIELHNQTIDQIILEVNKNNNNQDNTNDIDISTPDTSVDNQIVEQEILSTSDSKSINDSDTNESNDLELKEEKVMTLPDFWERADKEEILFLLDNMLPVHSEVLNNAILESLTLNSSPPQNFTENEFNHMRIVNLIKLGQRKKAFEMIKIDYDNLDHLNFYNFFKLNYYFSTYELNQACDFSNSIDRKKSTIDKNFLLKVDIFCAFLNNKLEESDFLNSLLEDVNDQDEYFQKILLNLKNSEKNNININNFNFNEKIMPLYSAMIRVGDMPLNHKFLEYDSANLSIPIVLSSSSDISLRLEAAHKAYQQGIFSAESLSALYQTVDFSYDELSNSEIIQTKLKTGIEIKMAYFFQKANIQLLPITRVQILVDFWNFAEKQNLSLLAYDISRNLLKTIEPSSELLEYSIQIAKAHIYNKNFELANKWILFIENYESENLSFVEKIESIKLLYNLKNSADNNQFTNILLNSGILNRLNEDTIKQEILLTIFSVVSENSENNFNGSRKLVDQRRMPSMYLLNKIKNSSENNNFGELALSIHITMIDKTWNEIHPEHLRIILSSLKNNNMHEIFNKIVLEILEENKII